MAATATALLLGTHHHPCKPRAPVLCRATARMAGPTSAVAALRSLAPPTRPPELLSLDLPRYDPAARAAQRPVDVAVVGCGPAGLAVAQRVAEAGLSVCVIDPCPAAVWPNTYGVWVDEFEAMGLAHCLDAVWPSASVIVADGRAKSLDRPYARVACRELKSAMLGRCVANGNGVVFHHAKVAEAVHHDASSLLVCDDGVAVPARVVLDATGFSRCLVQYSKPYNPGYQVAYGILAEVDAHPFDTDKILLMDWRDSHLHEGSSPTFLYAMPFSPTRIFLEETSLVARPGLAMEDLQERMAARLGHLGIRVRSVEWEERGCIPMGGPLPDLTQRVVGFGGAAGMVHPSTGYMLARTLAAAPVVADAIVRFLDTGNGTGGLTGDALSSEVWKQLWPASRRRQREFFCLGMEILLQLDLEGTRRFFDAFLDLEPHYWNGFMSSTLSLPELLMFGLAMFRNASNTSRLETMTKAAVPLAKMIGNLIQDRDG